MNASYPSTKVKKCMKTKKAKKVVVNLNTGISVAQNLFSTMTLYPINAPLFVPRVGHLSGYIPIVPVTEKKKVILERFFSKQNSGQMLQISNNENYKNYEFSPHSNRPVLSCS